MTRVSTLFPVVVLAASPAAYKMLLFLYFSSLIPLKQPY